MSTKGLRRYLLFTAPNTVGHKYFSASFDQRISAIEQAEKLKVGVGMKRWQVIDSRTGEVVAEDPGLE
jgi:hypothetical protein